MHTIKTQTAGMRAGTARPASAARTVRPARIHDNGSTSGVSSMLSTVCRARGVVSPPRSSRDLVQARAQLFNGLTLGGKKQDDSKRAAPPSINCVVYTQEGANTNLDLLLSFVGKQQFQVGDTIDLSAFKSRPWTREEKDPKTGKVTTVRLGVIYEGEVDVPQDAVEDIIFLRLKPTASVEKEYINRIEISKDKDGDGGVINVAANSWIHKSQGGRFFFAKGLALLPSETPEELKLWREAELEEAKGTTVQSVSRRNDWDRIWDYDVYNDLAGYDANDNIVDRVILGGSEEYPYPRRIRTGRNRIRGPSGELTYETRDSKSGDFWVPLDERFNTIKDSNFKAYGLLAIIPATAESIWRKLDCDQKLSSFKEVNSVYAKLQDPNFTINAKEFVNAINTKAGRMRDSALKRFGIKAEDLPQLQLPGGATIDLGAVGSSFDNIRKLVGGAQNLLDFPPPLVAKNRPGVWDTDEEWGRQALAGVNPSCIKAVASKADLGGITEAHLKDSLGGRSLDALIAACKTEPRLLVIDYTAVFPEYAKKITELGDRYGYSGRAVLFHGDDGHWVPVAIELQGSEGQKTVYTRKGDHPNIWRLAKGTFLSLDSGFHQLITHWLRCHACTEPYIIATNRCLSSIHPVFKLMMPHWRFTPQINANARQNLINAGGIIELTFTPGRYALEMSSKVYGALWRFDNQGLPNDLIGRGLAKKEHGKMKLLLKDYPYADDGMLIWDAVHEWVGKYLRVYYNDSDPAKSVAGDSEIQNWWNEIQTKGHPDKKEGWPELNTIDDLTEILTTMIWVASAHHAAINFSQYAYTGYFLNRPTICTKRIPQKDTQTYRDLTKDNSAAAGEKAYLDVLSTPDTLKAVLTVELLSTHADNEVYLNEPTHPYILDATAKKLYDEFVAKINGIEQTIMQRNKDPARKTRNGGTAIPYEFLVPSSPQSGISNRGIPQSVSI